MTWWDPLARRYRSSLPHKVLYVWGWPAIRAVMFALPSETAHHLAIHGIRIAAAVDRVWSWLAGAAALAALLAIGPLLLLPWFTCRPPDDIAPD